MIEVAFPVADVEKVSMDGSVVPHRRVPGAASEGEASCALAWQPVRPVVTFPTEQSLRLTLVGGQCFRWREVVSGIFLGCWGRYQATVRRGTSGQLEYLAEAAPGNAETQPPTADGTPESQAACSAVVGGAGMEAALADYFAAEVDFAGADDALPWRSDAVLSRARNAVGGLRLLRQPVGETLLSYLCSSVKRIEQIRELTDALGRELGPRPGVLPTWESLSQVPEARLRGLGLGYRARYISQTAAVLSQRAPASWESDFRQWGYLKARSWLQELPGVGPKIADCVCLFGGGYHEAFPVDTWILQILAQHYGLVGWTPEQLAQFARCHFGPAAGLAQQYLFEAARLGVLAGPAPIAPVPSQSE